MKFDTALAVQNTITYLDEIENVRALNRARVQEVANGMPPFSAEEAKKHGLQINVDWKEMAMLLQRARQQYRNAFQKPNQYFTVTINDAPSENKDEWSNFVTKKINRVMKRSKQYRSLLKNKFAGVVLSGVGLQMWPNGHQWMPEFVPIENFRVPTDTDNDFSNLSWFAVYREYTPGELVQKAFGDGALDPGWQQKQVKKILLAIKDDNFNRNFTNVNETNFPEKMVERIKQDIGYWMSDSVPVVPMWDFYFEDRLKNGNGWLRRVVADISTPGDVSQDWIYTSGERPVATKLEHLLHLQCGDLNNKPPFKYHSIRSLGYLMMEPCFWTNIARCHFVQHMLEQFNIWLRVADPTDRSRAQFVQLGNTCIVPDGVAIVPTEQRHRIDANLVQAGLAEMRQLMSEASTSYTQNVDTGTDKEQTAYETSIKANLANALLSSMLDEAYTEEVSAYEEISRRFCRKTSLDDDAREFRKLCKEHGIPDEYLNPEEWTIEAVTALGMGNRQVQLATASQLMQSLPLFGPEGQDIIKHDYVSVLTDDPKKADRIAPLNQGRRITDSIHDAQLAFGALMEGVPVEPQEGMNPMEQVETMLSTLSLRLKQVQIAGMPSPQELIGFHNVGAYIGAQIQRVAQDKRNKERVKQYSDALAQMMNMVEKLTQNSFNQQKANGNGNGAEDQQKLQMNALNFQQKTQQKQLSWQQRAQQRQIEFQTRQQQAEQQHQIDLRREGEKAALENAAELMKTSRRFAFQGGE